MQRLKIIAEIEVPIAKKSGEAVDAAIKLVSAARAGMRFALGQVELPDVEPVILHRIIDDDSPAPPAEPKRRKRRQALGTALDQLPTGPTASAGAPSGEYPGPEIPESLRRPA